MNKHLEEAEQAAFVEWAQYQRSESGQLLIMAIPNGSYLAGDPKQRAFQMARLKKAGLKTGAGDLFVAAARGGWHGLFIEMKKCRDDFRTAAEANAAPTEEQLQFGEMATRAGYRYIVCYGFEEAMAALIAYLDGRDRLLTDATPTSEGTG